MTLNCDFRLHNDLYLLCSLFSNSSRLSKLNSQPATQWTIQPWTSFRPPDRARNKCSRPLRLRCTSLAFSRTRRCLEIAGSEMRNGMASSVTRNSARLDRRSKMRRRVGSAKAAKTDDNCFRLLTTGSDLYSSQPAGVKYIFNTVVKYPKKGGARAIPCPSKSTKTYRFERIANELYTDHCRDPWCLRGLLWPRIPDIYPFALA